MLRSMTAYGRHAVDSQFGELVWELRSVNHRYLDVSVRLPEDLRRLEPDVRERAAARLHRGKVEITLRMRASARGALPFTLDTATLEKLQAAIATVHATIPELSPADPIKVLQWPGMVTSSADDQELLSRELLDALEAALDDFVAAREREGEKTARLVQARADEIQQQVAQVRQHRPAVIARQRARLVAKLNELDLEHDAQRLEQELVYTAQRLDIDEELDRLDNHIAELGKVLDRRDSVGRRLDFLMQEFNREANTLGSKAADIDTTGASVEIKVLIEQMREQVQNIE